MTKIKIESQVDLNDIWDNMTADEIVKFTGIFLKVAEDLSSEHRTQFINRLIIHIGGYFGLSPKQVKEIYWRKYDEYTK